jgi:SAM-dependent methyltransferase
VTFAAPAESYDRYMGRWSQRLAPLLAEFAGVELGMRVLDVGCGTGSLTEVLAERVGANQVAGAEPSAPFAEGCAARVPGADVRVASAERLPWEDGAFDVVVSQLVLNFLGDAVAGVREMRRVSRQGTIAACVWDYEEMGMLRVFWDAALTLDPGAPAEHLGMRLGKPEQLGGLWREAGCEEVETEVLEVAEEYESFEDYWEPFLAGIGPGGSYGAGLDDDARTALRDECRRALGEPSGPFRLEARASAVRGRG